MQDSDDHHEDEQDTKGKRRTMLIAGAIVVALIGVLIGILLPLGAGPAPTPEVPQENIEQVLGREISGTEAVETIDQIFSPDGGEIEWCCGHASCECIQLGDCINMWFADVCTDIDGPDIQNGLCEKDRDVECTNPDCSCPD
jgi:hypothetical protein